MSSPSKRREMDLMKLMMSDYKVEMINDGMQEFYVHFHGPTESPYHGGVWKIRVELPDAYPYKSPSIGFINKIYHPNVDEMSGSVCLDVINQTWSPMFDLVNVFEVFLPQLLLYPNPSDPLNGEAAALMMRDRAAYDLRVKGATHLCFSDFGDTHNCSIAQVFRCSSFMFWVLKMEKAADMSCLGLSAHVGKAIMECEEFSEVAGLTNLLKYAKPEDVGAAAPEEKSSDEELSEAEYDSADDAVAGPVDP
ncbi:hypothetical protein H5410_011914 [Solanum commersonii]|uniref:E2 ubiquitin-conjugating enzyme n=1 Tax=Solanum commersonii TaxID=4109 RepID=A0A9J6APW8_SOLCO|nr:hypothetical protein H5410_011914 [Solanum commersonii]